MQHWLLIEYVAACTCLASHRLDKCILLDSNDLLTRFHKAWADALKNPYCFEASKPVQLC